MSFKTGIYFVGEAIADQRPDPSNPRSMKVSLGGSMYFGSIGAARAAPKDVGCFYVGPISDDYFGGLMMQDFETHAVQMDYIRRTPFISMIAVISEDGKGGNKYCFYGRNQMNTTEHLQLSQLPENFAEENRIFCFGSVATTLSPSGQTLKAFAALQKQKDSVILYDPNTRPTIIPDRAIYEKALESWIATASIAKASEEDIQFTYPHLSFAEVAQKWLSLGVKAVFVTQGINGCSIYTAQGVQMLPTQKDERIRLTVGAGDNFNAGIALGLAKRQATTKTALDRLEFADWVAITQEANQTSLNHLKRLNAID